MNLRILFLMYFCVVFQVVGCVQHEDDSELDHFVPAHWPSDMQDLATKIDERVKLIDQQQLNTLVRSELIDLASWSPEIAADTDLTETEWNDVYYASEALREHLLAKDVPIQDCREDFVRLVQLLRELDLLLSERNQQALISAEQFSTVVGPAEDVQSGQLKSLTDPASSDR